MRLKYKHVPYTFRTQKCIHRPIHAQLTQQNGTSSSSRSSTKKAAKAHRKTHCIGISSMFLRFVHCIKVAVAIQSICNMCRCSVWFSSNEMKRVSEKTYPKNVRRFWYFVTVGMRTCTNIHSNVTENIDFTPKLLEKPNTVFIAMKSAYMYYTHTLTAHMYIYWAYGRRTQNVKLQRFLRFMRSPCKLTNSKHMFWLWYCLQSAKTVSSSWNGFGIWI